MYRIVSLSLLLFCLLCLTACGGDKPGAAAAPPAAAPHGGPAVTVYMSLYQPQHAELFAEFEERTGTRVIVLRRQPGEMLGLAAEGNLTGDLAITPDLEYAVALRAAGALQPFFTDYFSTGNVLDAYLDTEGYYAGLTRWTMAVLYDPLRVAIGQVSKYHRLADPALKGRIGIAHPDSSGLAGLLAGMAMSRDAQTASVYGRYLANNLPNGAFGNDYDQMRRLLNGEVDCVLVSSAAATRFFLSGNAADFEANSRFRYMYPTTAEGINLPNATCITMLKNAPNRDAALRLIDFLYEPESQLVLGSANFEYPVEKFAEMNEYLSTIADVPGNRLPLQEIENQLPIGFAIVKEYFGAGTVTAGE